VPSASLEIEPLVLPQCAAEQGVALTDDQAQRLIGFARLLAKWSAVYNLTTRREPAEILTHHLLDSLAVVPFVQRYAAGGAARILDVGSGGGLPGIPIAIALPELRVTVIDAVAKKCAFMTQAKVELALGNLDVVHARVERFRADAFDCIVSRAFAALADFVSLTRHLLRPGGVWLAMKGALPAEELDRLPDGTRLIEAVKLRVPRLDEQRHLIILGPA
jgi:16S rRNA (guanine527-N7)-methyltransferase